MATSGRTGGSPPVAVGVTFGTIGGTAAEGNDSRIVAVADKVSKGTLIFDAQDYGLVADGVADDTAAIQAAINAASAAGGGEVYLPARTMALSSAVLTLPSNVGLRGAGMGRTVLLQKYWPTNVSGFSSSGNALIMAAGSFGTSLTCSAAAPNATAITGISSTAGLSAGSWALLASQDYYWSGYTTRYKAELVRIASVDSASQVTIYGVVRDNYATGAITLTPITFVTNVSLSDLTIRNTEPNTTHATAMVWFNRVKGLSVNRVELDSSDYAGLRITNVHGATVTDCYMHDFTDVPANSQLGYAVLTELATESVVIESCRFQKVRHAHTTGGYTPTLGGAPRSITISNCIAQDCSESAFDTHQTGGECVFIGNTVIGTKSAAFSSRSIGCRFIGNSVSYAQAGIIVWGEAGGVGHGTVIQANVIRHIWGNFGIRVYDADRVVISDNLISSVQSAGIYVGDNATNLTIVNNRIENTGISSTVKSGIHFVTGLTGTGHRIERNSFYNGPATTGEPGTGPGQMDYCIRNLSSGITGSWFANNTCIGSVTAMVSDAGGNVDHNNVRLDQAISLPAHASQHLAGGTDRLVVAGGHDSATRFDTYPRVAAAANLTLTSGTLYLAYFTAPAARSVTSLIAGTGTNGSPPTVTLGRLAIFSVDGSGNLTLIQASTNDTSLFAAANTFYTKTISSAALTAGSRYAIGILIISSAGTIICRGASSVAGLSGLPPALAHALTGQSDIPSSVTVGSLATTGNVPWGAAS